MIRDISSQPPLDKAAQKRELKEDTSAQSDVVTHALSVGLLGRRKKGPVKWSEKELQIKISIWENSGRLCLPPFQEHHGMKESNGGGRHSIELDLS